MSATKKCDSWTHNGHPMEFCTNQNPGEPYEDFCRRHEDYIKAMMKQFPPD